MKKASRFGAYCLTPLIVAAMLNASPARADDGGDNPTPNFIPKLLGAQYTGIDQHQYSLRSPYAGPLSLHPKSDTEQTHTFGLYFGVQLPAHFQFYADIEKFDGEGVSGATGLGGLTNGDVVRSGSISLPKRPYMARHYLRYEIPLGDATVDLDRAQDQLPAKEFKRRLEFKLGKMAVPDDFDKNRYNNSTRTQFMNWSLWDNSAWDYAADTRGYTNGFVAGFVGAAWAVHYGVYEMPVVANGQALDKSLMRSRGENLELMLDPVPDRWVLRLLAYRNTARMGSYRNAIAAAVETGQPPNVQADDRNGRHKTGYGVNVEVPLADAGETGLFARYGWNDGHNESYAFTEVDRNLQLGGQVSGEHWGRPKDRLGLAYVIDGLSQDHRDYLAAGGSGFVLGDGRLNYGTERVLEAYYSFQPITHVSISPDFQVIVNPGYNRDRGPAKFVSIRLHLEY